MPTSTRAQRLARGWIVGLAATTVAAVSHSLAGGYRPGALSFGAALVFAGVLGTLVIGLKPSLPRLAVAVGVSQLAFHLLFSLLGAGGTAAGTAVDPHGMPGMTGMADPGVAAPALSHAADHLLDPGMWIAHAVAAVLTILFLRHAELAVWAMLTRLGRVIVRRLAVALAPTPTAPAAPRPVAPAVATPVELLLASSASRRGPPLLAF